MYLHVYCIVHTQRHDTTLLGGQVTAAMQAAPLSVPLEYRTQVANICTVCFQAAFAAALLIALALRPVLFPPHLLA